MSSLVFLLRVGRFALVYLLYTLGFPNALFGGLVYFAFIHK